MKHTVGTIGLLLLAAGLLLAPGIGQAAAQNDSYKQAQTLAQAGDYERAYDLAVKFVSSDPLSYDGYVLKIALATILKKSGVEAPQNLMRVAKNYAPIGSNIELDVQNMINRLSGIAPPKAREPVVVSPYVQHKLALVIGVGVFKDTKINPLSFTANDATSFAQVLQQECGFDSVQTLIDQAATQYNIKTAIDKLAKQATAEDLVVIFFASHGSPDNMDAAGINYIVTHDTEVDNLYATAYKMDDLLNDIEKRIASERVVAFIDTCYSGATFKMPPAGWTASSRSLGRPQSGLQMESIQRRLGHSEREVKLGAASAAGARKVQQAVGRVIIAASRQNEESWESPQLQHGYFTYYLLEGLKRRGAVSVQDLYDFVHREVPQSVQRERKAQQNPTMVTNIEGPAKIYLRDSY